MANVKAINGLLRANVKSRNGLVSANIKTINGVDAVVSGGSPFGGLVSTTDLVEWWPLSEASGNRAGVHAGLTLTDNNTVTGSAGGGPDGSDASLFVGANSEFLSRASEAALQTSDADYSWCCWVYLNSTAAVQAIFCKSNPVSVTTREWELQYSSSASRFRMVAYNNTTAMLVDASTIGAPSTGQWYFIYFDHDATANTIGISVNDGTRDTTAFTGGLSTGTVEMRIGAFANNVNYLSARVQRCGMWSRLLTSGERTALYNSGNGLDY